MYSLVIHLLRPFAIGWVAWRGLGDRRYWIGMSERFGWGRRIGSSIWVHAVSLGEVTAAAPLIDALRARHPGSTIVLTTATLTGRSRAAALGGGALDVRFLPYDTSAASDRFLERVRPRVAVIMETELWPNLYAACRRRGIPVVLASARLSDRSVRRYRRCGSLFRRCLLDTIVAAQTCADADRFVRIGADRRKISVIGNVKFDAEPASECIERGRDLRAKQWAGRPVWAAGSTHEGEEDVVLDAHERLSRLQSGALLLLAPRHPERFERVAELLNRRKVRFERRSSGATVRADSSVLLADTIGELACLYAAVDVAFVGGSLVPVGGHNLLEVSAAGVPVLTGPFQSNGREIAQLLLSEAAAIQVADGAELTAALDRLLGDADARARMGENGRRVVAMNRGSVVRLLAIIETLLDSSPAVTA
ncbi:MAG: lipid IV(A) 3-deoxy-D-manno-octulosonic acid transferase [Steroidobacteraceae bacterium]